MNVVKFSYNWNNKLNCKAFPTVRKWNPARFAIGSTHQIYLKSELKGTATVVYHRCFTFDEFNEFIAMLDTGYTLDDFKNIFRKMYRDAETARYSFVVFRYIETS